MYYGAAPDRIPSMAQHAVIFIISAHNAFPSILLSAPSARKIPISRLLYLKNSRTAYHTNTVIGLYQLLVYSVSCRQKGRNPQKYYNNLLYYGMMKFQGASVVRNMLVITLLLMHFFLKAPAFSARKLHP